MSLLNSYCNYATPVVLELIYEICEDRQADKQTDKQTDSGVTDKQTDRQTDRQTVMLLLRHCHVPKLDYLARTVFPGQLNQAAKIHDTQLHNTFSNLLGYDQLDDSMWQQASLPIRLGGFGMTLLTSVFQHTFVASWTHTIIELPFRFPALMPLIDSLVISPPTSPIGQALCQSLPPNKMMSDFLTTIHKLQHQLSKTQAESLSASLIDNAATARDASRLSSIRGKGAGAWLSSVQSSRTKFLRLSLGIPFESWNVSPLSDWLPKCHCGTLLDDSGCHLLTCKSGAVLFGLTRPLHQYGLTIYGIFIFITDTSQDIATPTRTTELTS